MASLPDWFDVFNAILARNSGALDWGLPEAWVHAELYAELKRRAKRTGWVPFSTEIPYVTALPVRLPSKTAKRDWRTEGAVKWVDLCLQSQEGNAWIWLEVKVRHIGPPDRRQKAAGEARDAFRKDVVALMGFDASATAGTWRCPDAQTGAYWFAERLRPKASRLQSGVHHFVAAYLQLGGGLDPAVWKEAELRQQVKEWFEGRHEDRGSTGVCPTMRIRTRSLVGGHALLLCEWPLPEQDPRG